jgi:hypothetical protein
MKHGRGHIQMHRGWLDHPMLGRGPYCPRAAWVWLVEHAAWKSYDVTVRGQDITLRRGQLAASHRFLAKAWRWDKGRVWRFLTTLKDEGAIASVTVLGETILVICNYDKYQITPDISEATNGARDEARNEAARDPVAGELRLIVGQETGQQSRQETGQNIRRYLEEGNINTVDVECFDTFWRAYPSRGSRTNPKKPAKAKFISAIKDGATAEKIIRGAENYAASIKRDGTDPQYVQQAQTWLNQQGWEGYQRAHVEKPRAYAPI